MSIYQVEYLIVVGLIIIPFFASMARGDFKEMKLWEIILVTLMLIVWAVCPIINIIALAFTIISYTEKL